jgi:hypothetical protein
MGEIEQGPAEFSQPSGGEASAPAEKQQPAKKAPAKKAAAKKATTKRRAPIRRGGHVLDPKTNRWVPDLPKRKGK